MFLDCSLRKSDNLFDALLSLQEPDHFLLSATPRLTMPPIASAAAPPTTAIPTKPSGQQQK